MLVAPVAHSLVLVLHHCLLVLVVHLPMVRLVEVLAFAPLVHLAFPVDLVVRLVDLDPYIFHPLSTIVFFINTIKSYPISAKK